MQQHTSTHSVLTHTLGPWGGVKIFFTGRSHGAYQTKGNGTQSTMQAHILSLNTQGSKYIFTESSRVAYRIKGN